MKHLAILGLALGWYPSFAAARTHTPQLASYGTFAATTPCDSAVRAPLAIPATANCELIQWSLVLSQDASTHAPTRYRLSVTYGYLAENTYRFTKGGADILREGPWTIRDGLTAAKGALVFQLDGKQSQESITLLKVDDNILHLLDRSQRLLLGNASWSYSLSRTGPPRSSQPVASTPAELTDSPSQESFEGRSPCGEVAAELGMDVPPACNKAKWDLTLNRDVRTGAPTTYQLDGTLYRQRTREGRWTIVRGTKSNPDAIVYQLLTNEPRQTLMLLRADQNILFFLDKERKLMVGDANFSYTLNRR